MQRALYYDMTPRLSVPLRFFMTAIVFAIFSCLLLLWVGSRAFSSRWTPETLALTHLWFLGCVTLTIIGALFQLFPVVGGRPLPQSNLYVNTILIGVASSAACLAIAFLAGQPFLFLMAALLASIGLGLFLAGCTSACLNFRRQHLPIGARPMFRTVTMALGFLGLVVFSGVINALLRSSADTIQDSWLLMWWPNSTTSTDIHAAMGLIGWITITISGISPQVIPVFQATEPYPRLIEYHLPLSITLSLMYWILNALLPVQWQTSIIIASLIALLLMAYALATIKTLLTRKRAKPDATTGFWYAAMLFLLMACLSWSLIDEHKLLLPAILLAGFAFSAINGMLYQILPFLIWLHAHSHALHARPVIPKIREMIPLRSAYWQCCLNIIAWMMMAAATYAPNSLTRPAASLLLASLLWSGCNVLRALGIYRKARHQQATFAAAHK